MTVENNEEDKYKVNPIIAADAPALWRKACIAPALPFGAMTPAAKVKIMCVKFLYVF